ncbi:MAG: hypothetical protein WB249_15970 [Candidatus Sulfotelmatobacter sp.]
MQFTEEEKKEWGIKDGMENITEGLGYCPPMTAAEHRAKADDHDKKADELLSGDKKDAHLIAARAHNAAADAIEKADLSTKKAEAFD